MNHSVNSAQSLQELQHLKIKLAALEYIMEEQGIDAAALFKEAGLVKSAKKSKGRNDCSSRVRIDPRSTDERPENGTGQCTLSSGGRRPSWGPGPSTCGRLLEGGGSSSNNNNNNRDLKAVMEISSQVEEAISTSPCKNQSNTTTAAAAAETKQADNEMTNGSSNLE
jgi:hypothetical protein